MKPSAFENLDLACAKVGKTIAERPSKELENRITDALAVLEEQGVYALFLYLKAQGKVGQEVTKTLQNFLVNTPQQFPLLKKDNKDKDIFSALQKLGENLDNLLLAGDLLRQIMVYARHHAKLRKAKEPAK